MSLPGRSPGEDGRAPHAAAATGEPVLIAGAGIGGLSTALGLQRAGFPVRVFEQADALREIGAGVSLAPNATRALRSLGLLDELRQRGNVPDRAAIKHYASAAELSGYTMGPAMEAEWGCPYVQIHRADLQTMLFEAVQRHDPQTVRFGARAQALSQDAGGVTLRTPVGSFRGSALVGADGIRSAVRAQLHGSDAPTFLGYVAWRGVVPAAALKLGPVTPDTAVYLGPRKSVLRYKVRGEGIVNVVAFARHEAWAEEGWSLPADPAELRAAFAGWAPEVGDLVEALCTTGCFKWGLFGRAALPHWQQGRVTLVGDAAHPMLPFLGQGAAMAIEDGVLLARALAQRPGVEAALATYEAVRYRRTVDTVVRADSQGLKLHGHPVDEPDSTPVPQDDFVEYAFDASTVPLTA